MDYIHPDTPKTERLIATLLEEHKNCPVKGHILVVTAEKQVLLKHGKQITGSDIIIAKLNPKHIHIGLSTKQWNDFSQAIIKAVKNDDVVNSDTSLFQ